MRFFILSVVVGVFSIVGFSHLVDAQSGPEKESIKRVVDEICSDGGAWLKCYSLEPSTCQSITSAFVEPCVKRVTTTRDDGQVMKIIERLLACFNEEFMGRYGAGEVHTPECKDPMAHLSRK